MGGNTVEIEIDEDVQLVPKKTSVNTDDKNDNVDRINFMNLNLKVNV